MLEDEFCVRRHYVTAADIVPRCRPQPLKFNRASYFDFYVCPMIWREFDNFSSGSVSMALASNVYDEADYYRDHDEFVRALRGGR